jgi:aspartyl-tRNA synthetase
VIVQNADTLANYKRPVMHLYRSHTCGALRADHIGQTVKLSGWIHRKRDHGGVLFIDLRDHYGLTQIVVNADSPHLETLERLRVESVVTITGPVLARPGETVNDKMPTGAIEVAVQELAIQSSADQVPLQVNGMDDAGEDIRLKYRYLDLRREKMQKNIMLRSAVMRSLRSRMVGQGFNEFQTPIITASSPEGARDYVVPSRLHPGKFYALPQAPQQFKQLLMVAGFDRYFQIAPCFRDEDGRADRLAEFYQLDVEMSFVTQDDIFMTMEQVVGGLFEEFNAHQGKAQTVTAAPFPRLTYKDAMLRYGSDKPDLRNPLEIVDVTSVFKRDDVTFNAFKGVIDKGGIVRAIRAPNVADRPRSFFDKLNDWARGEGAPGLGYIVFEGEEAKGPIAKFVPEAALAELKTAAGLKANDAVFFVCDKESAAVKLAGKARNKICDEIGGIKEENTFKLCWIVDFPMYEEDEKTGKIDFAHNPFSMPQGGLEALESKQPLDVVANQYDCVCNGFEIASGGIRNHRPDIMAKAFSLAGYSQDDLEKKFGGMLNAFRFGPPPHGGCAFGIDRMIMLIADEPNLREVYAFVMNGNYEDPMMNAPGTLTEQQLQDLHLRVALPPKLKAAS